MDITTSISNDKYLICEHLGALIAAKISSDSHRIEVETFRLDRGSLSKEKGETIRTRPIVAWIVGIAFADDVLYCDLGIYLPTFLVIINTREAAKKLCFAIFVLVNGELKLLKSMFCPAGVDFSNPNVTPVLDVCEGPTVLLVDVETVSVHVCYANDDAFREINMDALYCNLVDDTTDCDSVAFRSVAPCSQGICTFVASFYIVKKADELDIEVKHRGFAVLEDGSMIIDRSDETNDYFKEIFSFVPPEEYWTILCVSEVVDLTPCDFELWPRLSKDQKKCLAFATELPSKGTAFLLISKSFQCCIVNVEQRKVLKHWTGVHHALIGDFNKVGHDQLLILFSAVINPQDVKFVLTDFLCCQKESPTDAENAPENSQVKKSLAAVAKALSTSSQATMLETSRAQTAFDAKNELIRETWHNMENMTLNEEQEESARSSNLVPLFEEEEERTSTIGNKTSANFQRPFQLLESHQEVMWNKWTVTVKVKINTTRKINNVFVHMLVEDQICQSPVVAMQRKQQHTKEGRYEGVITDDILGESSRKIPKCHTISQRQKNFARDQEIILTATTDLPDFSHKRIIEASLMVTWEELEDNRTDISSYSCYVGTIELDVEKVVSGMYAPKNLQSIARDFESIEMLVTSKHNALSSLPDRLKDPLQKINCGLSGATEDANVAELVEKSSGHVFLCLSTSKLSAEIKVYARTPSQATLIFHVIASTIPPDSQISLPLQKLNELVDNLNRCLSRELLLLETMLEGNNGSKNIQQGTGTVCPDDFIMEVEEVPLKEKSSSRAALQQARVDKMRNDFQRKRKRAEYLLNEAKCSTINPEMYREYHAAMRESNQAAELLYLVRVEETLIYI